MTRDEAVARIKAGLGFKTNQDANIVLRLQEAQRELEAGKTLPPFLLQEDAILTFAIGTSFKAAPTGFLRPDENNPLHYVPVGATSPAFVTLVAATEYSKVLNQIYTTDRGAPSIGVLRRGTASSDAWIIDFINVADITYNLTWSYYKRGALLSANIENEWLLNAPEWLIGEAGWRMAMDLRDKDAITIFDSLRKSGRAACFGEIIAREDSTGPFVMGANL